MVRVVVAGGSGNVAREVIDALLTAGHQVTIFSRKDVSSLKEEGLDAVQVNYTNKPQLIELLEGINTVLSFVVVAQDPGNVAQKTLIDASIEAGVKRFAPNEWSTRSRSGVSWYEAKDEVHDYLKSVNKEKKILEYTLFQPGLFLNYLSYPHNSAKHFHNTELQYDFENRRAIVLGDGTDRITFTTIQDLGAVVAAAVGFDGNWPETGGIRGGQITVNELIRLGEKIRGASFDVVSVTKADLEAGNLTTSWIPTFTHPNVNADELQPTSPIPGQSPPDPQDAFSRLVVRGSLLAIHRGVWDVSDEWNRLLPDLKRTSIEDFLDSTWKGKP
ncbi:nmrA-like family protein-like protein [Amylocarpus encephaloides]|uniref:NmrA-like family protein-like protein n=1 Tax=Amylocarpus encephaloides TaxID=45428 RepID=A0A9P7YE13_9HELO|nr:nmrA-like family protein-like protein [Amylocarpus encephaloides]